MELIDRKINKLNALNEVYNDISDRISVANCLIEKYEREIEEYKDNPIMVESRHEYVDRYNLEIELWNQLQKYISEEVLPCV